MKVFKLVLALIIASGVAWGEPSYLVRDNVHELLYKKPENFPKLQSKVFQSLKSQSDFLKSCDPTEGEEIELKKGCEEVHKILIHDLRKNEWGQYAFHKAAVSSAGVDYQFIRSIPVMDWYGCQLILDLNVTLENTLKYVDFDLYCDS